MSLAMRRRKKIVKMGAFEQKGKYLSYRSSEIELSMSTHADVCFPKRNTNSIFLSPSSKNRYLDKNFRIFHNTHGIMGAEG
jgi:hypothetical protein